MGRCSSFTDLLVSLCISTQEAPLLGLQVDDLSIKLEK